MTQVGFSDIIFSDIIQMLNSISAGVAQLVEQGFCKSESESGDSPSETDDVDDKRDKKGS